jgi:hypothetical protein
MMAKKLVMPSKLKNSVSPSQALVGRKTVATSGVVAKKVAKVEKTKRATKTAKKLNKPAVKKAYKK